MKLEKKDFLKFLKNLIAIPSITGQESEIVEFIASFLKECQVPYKLTHRRGILIDVPGKGKKDILLSAHYDTLGGMVKKVTSEGEVYFERIGSYPWVSVLGAKATIISQKKKFSSRVVAKKFSSHIYDDKEIESQDWSKSLYLRVDAEVEEIKKHIQIGDFVFFNPVFEVVGNYLTSRHLDDKVGVALILWLIKKMSEQSFSRNKPFGVFLTGHEEIGFGAKYQFLENYKYFLAVDIGIVGEGQHSREDAVTICLKDGVFPYDMGFIRELQHIAQKYSIPYVTDIFYHYGSDAAAMLGSGYDLKVGLIGTGVRESHSWERTHWKGVEATYQLLWRWLET